MIKSLKLSKEVSRICITPLVATLVAMALMMTSCIKKEVVDYEEFKKAGEEFLANNAKKEGVVVLPSGLQFKAIYQGSGQRPTLTDHVKCHYEGRLFNGNKFDSSYDRGEPAIFPVNGVIPGWTEALQLMPVGSKWQLFIPYNLAYGKNGVYPQIPPYSVLIFDIELLGIEK